ncbi:phosphatase PAP2 family protein [Parasphingopyxis sp.]|uniref:phosphatase PAP2 family protein n=1 Tax=Parasphingopyxis sp. TaxID=1920299 RepID=UPI00261DEBC6|nr:phosphatase PAP2 family protein [Parasphingopyxis sp.]
MRDFDWLVPSIALTIMSGLIAILLIPSYSGILPAIAVLPIWVLAACVLVGGYGLVSMMRAGVDSPVAHVRETIALNWRSYSIPALGIVIAGLNMTTFMWTKPLLNYLVPFWADPLLADIDYWLFFGNDPWVFLTWLNTMPMAFFYHRGWFVMMLIVLLLVLTARPSPQKSALMLTYFLMWSVIGPVIHIMLPATGPIFYADMGYGDRFADLGAVSQTREVAAYLWSLYSVQGFGAGAGISAMPSLHITTTVWMIVAVQQIAPRWNVPIAAAGFLIFLLSIALGWHYAVDGIVGGAAAWACYKLTYAFYNSWRGLGRGKSLAVG